MLGSHPISAVLGADVTADSDTAVFRSYLKGLTEVGLHVLFCKPGTKEPDDLRTTAQAAEDDEIYNIEVNGTPGTSKHPGGVHLATNNLDRLRKYVTRYRKVYGDGKEDKNGTVRPIAPVTIGISVGPSNLVVVDCDTAAQREAFGSWMAEKSGNPLTKFTTPTVLSPGVFRDGQWVHRDGGHFYFAVGDVELPALVGKMTVEHNGESFDVFWNNRYVLIPPSRRSEGKYERIGPVLNLSDNMWLAAEIDSFMNVRLNSARSTERNPMPVETVEALYEWYECTPWVSLLAPEGWEFAGHDMSCGCEVWNRPGWSNNRSAVAHVIGCRGQFSDSADPPIHFFTSMPGASIEKKLDEVGGIGRTLSKLQLYSALQFGGDDGMALRSIPEIPMIRSTVVFEEGYPFGMSTTEVVYQSSDTDDDESSYVVPNTPSLYAPEHVPNTVTSGVTSTPVQHTSEPPANPPLSSPENLASPPVFESSQKSYSDPVSVTSAVMEPVTNPVTHGVPTLATSQSENVTNSVTEPSTSAPEGGVWDDNRSAEIRETVTAVVNETLSKLVPEMVRLIRDELRQEG